MAIFVLTVVGLMMAANAVNAEKVINYRMCPDSDCIVYDMFIDPCPETLYNQPCRWPAGSNTSVAFIYKTEFGASLPKTQLYAETWLMDFPFLGIDLNACLYTNCPVEKDTEQYWLFDLYIPKNYEASYNTLKFMLWDNKYEHQCCFTFDIKIIN